MNAFCYFLKATKIGNTSLADVLRDKNWARFAYVYNGSRYRANAYDDKLRHAYQEYKAKAAA
ncbi:N-acetylmuramidase domain-containing protein [Massilia sp. 9096]|uniref:N-acetylmuramidase domain-containing protein n=1 Tax=Massilia sp. 9096 TaxID=1500894 RepID=UPI0009DF0249|nr:N-acetylmuramidase domain-containing protein [Massilia sp. 9096]